MRRTQILEVFFLLLLGLASIPTSISPARAATPAPGYAVSDYVTGFPTDGNIGPLGLAMGASGNLYVADHVSGNIYRFPRTGAPFVASSTYEFVTASTLSPYLPHGMTIGNGSLYLNLGHSQTAPDGEVVQIDLSSGTIARVVACGILWPSGLAVDPISGDLFVSQSGLGSNIYRIPISSPSWNGCSSGTPPVYNTKPVPNADGLVFSPDGTLYAAAGGLQGVVAIDGTDSRTSGNWTQITSIPGADGIATSLRLDVPILYSNNNGGTITKVCLSPSPTCPPATNIVTGGSRGDFDTVGADYCLYATQTNSVLKVTNVDGSCRPAPLGQLFQHNPSVTTKLFTSTDVSIRVSSAVPTQTSVYDTAKVVGVGATNPTGNVTYTFFANGECAGPGTNQTVILNSGIVPNSDVHSSLTNGDYAFQATYNGDTNYFPSTSPCEWFTVGSDFDLKSSSSIILQQGGSGTNSVVATLTNGTSFSVSLSCTGGLPSGATCTFNPASGQPSFTSTLTVTASSTTPTGSFTITLVGTGGGLTRLTRFLLTVGRGGSVGGVALPIDKLGLVAPIIGLALIITAAIVVPVVLFKRSKREV